MADLLDSNGNLISAKSIGADAGRRVAAAVNAQRAKTLKAKQAGGIDPDLVRAAELVLHADARDITKASSTLAPRLGIPEQQLDVQAVSDWILVQGGQLQAEAARVRGQSVNYVLDRKIREGYEHRADELDRRIEKALAAPAPSQRLLTTKAAKDADQTKRNALRREAAELNVLADRCMPSIAAVYRQQAREAAEAAER